MMGLTYRQRQCLDFIRAHIRDNVISPTFREIREGMGFNSNGGVETFLAGLIVRGYITLEPGIARSIRILGDGIPAPRVSYKQIIQALQRDPEMAGRAHFNGLRLLSTETKAHRRTDFPPRELSAGQVA